MLLAAMGSESFPLTLPACVVGLRPAPAGAHSCMPCKLTLAKADVLSCGARRVAACPGVLLPGMGLGSALWCPVAQKCPESGGWGQGSSQEAVACKETSKTNLAFLSPCPSFLSRSPA